MNRKEYTSTLRKAIAHYGTRHQQNQAKEELAELIVALSHYERVKNGMEISDGKTLYECVQEIVTEIADCRIMLDQLEILFGCAEDVNKEIQYKAERLAFRIERDEKSRLDT